MNFNRRYSSAAARTSGESLVQPGEEVLDSDTGNAFLRTISGWVRTITAGIRHFTKAMRAFTSGTLVNGTPVVVTMEGAPIPSTVWVVPVSGDTVLVEVSFDAGVSYENWAKGSVTARASDVLNSGVTHLRFSRTAGSGTTSTYGVS